MLVEVISLFFLIFTSLFGIAALLKLLFESLFAKRSDRILAVLPVRGEEPDLDCTLQGLLRQSERPVAVVDFGMDRDAHGVILRLMERFEQLILLRPDEVAGWVAGHRPEGGTTPNQP